MKKGEIYEGTVREVLFPNKGITECEGEKCTVKNVLPGQRIRFRVTKKRHGDCEGNCTEVLEKAVNELDTPNCPHYGICGGCSYQSL